MNLPEFKRWFDNYIDEVSKTSEYFTLSDVKHINEKLRMVSDKCCHCSEHDEAERRYNEAVIEYKEWYKEVKRNG
jgi:hypothetical protein